MSRRSRRARRRLRRLWPLPVLALALALIASVGADPYIDPNIRSALIPLGLLAAHPFAALAVDPWRRRT